MISLKRNQYRISISERTDGCAKSFTHIQRVHQVHSTTILEYDGKQNLSHQDADGIMSCLSRVALGVVLADCNGIVFLGRQWFAVIHAGWKGLHEGIVENTVQLLIDKGEFPSDIEVILSPSIRKCCYEVGDEFLGLFSAEYLKESHGESLHMDMIAYIKNVLVGKGLNLEKIEDIGICTRCSEQFFSWRGGDREERFLMAVEKVTG